MRQKKFSEPHKYAEDSVAGLGQIIQQEVETLKAGVESAVEKAKEIRSVINNGVTDFEKFKSKF